jgi:hypothetical protein
MVEVEIRAPVYNEETQQIESKVLALVRAEAGSLDVYPPDSWTVPFAPVISLTTGKPVEPADDPEEWARNLPYAYRSGDLAAVVRHDDNPPALEPPDLSEDEPVIPDPPAPALEHVRDRSAEVA